LASHRNKTSPASPTAKESWRGRQLIERPGFLIRRLHQIHTALFIEECVAFDITPVQYSVMTVLAQQGDCDQTVLAREIGMDRTNIADVLARLAGRGLVTRSVSKTDKRMRRARLTRAGNAMMAKLDAAAERAHARTVEALPPKERKRLLADLVRLVEANNDIGRAPLLLNRGKTPRRS
jgi:MarR family transcriptional regulator, lower aerobic nicotinate degradation pathway regulator